MQVFPTLVADWLFLLGRCALAVVFVFSAMTKLRLEPAEQKVLASLHIPAPALVEFSIGIFETLCVAALALGIYARIASVLLAIFLIGITLVVVLPFWLKADTPEVRAQMRNSFGTNVAIVGGLLLLIAVGPGGMAIMPQY
jgi:putative oxidoreductase